MTDSLIETEILAACSGLGYFDGNRYYCEADCLETIKDLIRYLRKDDDSHEIRRALGQTKVLQTDLIPIIKYYNNDGEIFDVTLRLLVNLTNPVVLLFKEELPEEKVTRQQYMQIISHQQAFKEAFADEGIWSVLVGRLGEILNKEWELREEEERLVVERILILVRNILVVAASPDEEKRTDDDASIHDQVLWALHLAKFEDLILYIASSKNEQDICMHIIEIISLMLKEQDAAQLANAGLQRLQSEKEKDEMELMSIRKKEAAEKQNKVKKHYSARHSRFGGTYYVNNMKSISERNLIAHKHITDIDALSFDHAKKPKKIPKNRLPLRDMNITRKSTLAIRLFLQEFCVEFLIGAFNHLMNAVKDDLDRAKAQEHDESYYLWAIKYFLEFNRSHNFRIELITETLNIQSFHYIQTLLENYYEMMTTDKKKIPLWSRRMHKALRAYMELLMTLSFMDKSEIPDIRESSRTLKNKVFYVVEYRELVLILLQNYDEVKMSKLYLQDLVETTHIFLKLLDGLCGKQKHLIVVNQKARRKSKVTKGNSKKPSENSAKSEEQLVMDWDAKSDDLLALVKGEQGELPLTIPFDSVSDVAEDEQKETCMKKINAMLRNGNLAEAVSLLRSSREIWPEGDIFGSINIDPLEEILCLRTIFMAEINMENSESQHETNDENDTENDSDEREELQETRISEQEFDIIGFVRRFSHIKVMQAYALIFKNFFNNSGNINHCILKMFHRLAWDCKIVAIFFQATIFKTFQRILDQPAIISQSHKDSTQFVKFIIKKFVQVAQENDKVFIELLFWKTNKEALEVECGYGCTSNDSKSTKLTWTEEEEDELRRLFEEFRDVNHETKDVVDLITENLINQNFTRRIVIGKLKDLHLIQSIKEISRKTVRVRASKQWSDEEIDELTELVKQFEDAVHPINRIMDHLSVKRSKNKVLEKILELGLVADRKALQKKRYHKSQGKQKNTGGSFLESNRADEDSDERVNDESDSDSDDERPYIRSKNQPSRSSRVVPDSHLAPTPELIKSSLNKVINLGMEDGVKWVAELILETADERETDGDFEPIPLLSMTDCSVTAMECEEFLDLLRIIGIRPPSSHEEMFWRIPSTISIDGLRKRAQYLLHGSEESQPTEDNLDETSRMLSLREDEEESSNEEPNPKTPQSSTSHRDADRDDDLSDTNDSPVIAHEMEQVTSLKRSLHSDEEKAPVETKGKKRRIIQMASDDEEEEDNIKPNSDVSLSLSTNGASDQNSYKNSSRGPLNSLLSSDDDDPADKTSRRTKLIIDSDDD